MSTKIKVQISLVIEHIRNNCLDYAPLKQDEHNLTGLWVLAENPNSMADDNYSLWLGERRLGWVAVAQLAS